jgi:hypothetical protein
MSLTAPAQQREEICRCNAHPDEKRCCGDAGAQRGERLQPHVTLWEFRSATPADPQEAEQLRARDMPRAYSSPARVPMRHSFGSFSTTPHLGLASYPFEGKRR